MMSPEQREYCQKKLSDLGQQIEKLEVLVRASVTHGSRAFWRAEAARLQEQRTNLENSLRRELTARTFDLLTG